MARKKRKIYATKFWKKNRDLEEELLKYWHPVGVGLEESGGYFYVVMHLREGVTSEDIRRAIPFALKLHDRLEEWQGKQFTYKAKDLLSLHDDKGASYGLIAKSLNRFISDLLVESAEWVRQRNSIQDRLMRQRFIQESYDTMGQAYNLDKASDLLRTVRFSDEEIESTIQEGLQNIYAGEPPFADEYPVSRDKVISALKYWRTKIK